MSLNDLLNRFTGRRISPLIPRPPNHPEPCLKGLPDFVEVLLGWRAWKVWVPSTGANSCPAFSSVILDMPWLPRRRISAEHSFDLAARCRGLLELDCSCGIYAFKDPVDAFIYLTKLRDRLLARSVDVALGAVSLWGKVIECEWGYKAQYAYPYHVYLPASFLRFVGNVSSAFGVSTGIYASIKEDEISLAIPSAFPGHGSRKLYLKNSGLITAQDFPYEIGFYDLKELPGRRYWPAMTPPDFSLPDSGPPEDPGGARWL